MTDKRIEQIVGTLLRAGVLLSAAVVLGGGVWWLAAEGQGLPAYQQFRLAPPELRQVGPLLSSLAHPRPETVIQFGLLLLIATPVARVIFAVAGFAIERDRLYAAISAVVLAILIYSIALPLGTGGGRHTTGLRNTPMPSISTSTQSP